VTRTAGRRVRGLRYADHLRSPEWRATRERYWRSKLPKACYVCGRPKHRGMHLHHRTYKNLGAERLMDLVPVCFGCHEEIHEYQRATGMDLWKAKRRARKAHRV
jgi:5-methylcytosine-specific restriction endonuclease McrA